MIEDIRKQHEELRDLIKPDQRDYIRPCISIADVDRLFAALDEAKDGLTAAHMHGFEEGRDQYRDKARKLQAALDAERGKVEKVLRGICIMLDHFDAFDELDDDESALVSDLKRFKQILTGEGK